MSARIYQPAKNAMQSGQGNTKNWILEFAPNSAREVDPLMGWTSSGDMDSQIKMVFQSKEEAMEYASSKGIVFSVTEQKQRKHVIRQGGYGENFATHRKETWTH